MISQNLSIPFQYVVPGDAVAEEGALGMPWGDMDEAPPAGLAGPRPANLDLAEGDLFVLRLLGGSDPSPVAFVRGGKLLEHQLKSRSANTPS